MKITPEQLIKKSCDMLKKRYQEDGHHSVVSATVLSKTGKVYTSLNVGTYQPSVAICAETVAIGMGHVAEKNFEIDTIVVLRGMPPYIISPCGRCREYIADYGPKAKVAVPADNKKGWKLMKISELLPEKYVRKDD